MKQEKAACTLSVQTEPYQVPHMEVIEMELEDAVLSGISSMPYDDSPW